MPSFFGHVVVGATAAHLSSQRQLKRRLLLVSLFCSVFADLDIITLFVGIPYDSLLGHRGLLHSILASFVMGYCGALFFLETWKIKKLSDWKWVVYFFLITVSHPLLDAATTGGHGVALFSPFNTHRYFLNHRTIYVSPLFISGFASYSGMRIVFKEAICIFLPCAIFSIFYKKVSSKFGKLRSFETSMVFIAPVILACIIGVLGMTREELVSGINGIDVHQISAQLLMKDEHGIQDIPLEDLPGHRLVLNYRELTEKNLFNHLLEPSKKPWSSSSFPIWLGGAAGRWQEPYWLQVWKVLMGHPYASPSDWLSLLFQSQTPGGLTQKAAKDQLMALAPTEKYDLAVSDYHLSSTRTETYLHGAGALDTFPHEPFWSGYCSSIGLASIYENEPKHPVEMMNSDGYSITFLPNDVKALLGVSYFFISPKYWQLGTRCELDGPKSRECLDVNPAALVIALSNLVGLAKSSFLINKEPFAEVQNAAIRQAEIRIVNPPYFVSERRPFFVVDTQHIRWLVDVEIRLTVSRIHALQSGPSEEELSYLATLGLDAQMNLVGGRWEDPFHHPNFAWGGSSLWTRPAVDHGRIVGNPLQWSILKALVEASSSEEGSAGHSNTPYKEKHRPVLQAALLTEDPIFHGLAFESAKPNLSGKVAYVQLADPIEVYGYVEGQDLGDFQSMDLVVHQAGGSEMRLASQDLHPVSADSSLQSRQFFRFIASGSLENLEKVALRLNQKKGPNHPVLAEPVEFIIPSKRKFDRLQSF